MNTDKITTRIGLLSLVPFLLDAAVQGGVVSPAIAPIIAASKGVLIAFLGYYTNKR